ncbi:MAG TPA: fused MFS/spermidine synthase [Azospirillaceae bacterium]|nr:fused MFS/spermidine synthase [Azospirillaceae bacterium]
MGGERAAVSARVALGMTLFVAFAAGFGVMMLEMLGGRLMTPFFGTSVYQWGATIGVVLTALSVGYWWGGRLGDGPHAGQSLLAALLVAALWAALTPRLLTPLLWGLRPLGPIVGALAGSMLVLAVPAGCLAMASPICARAVFDDLGKAATAAGLAYAWGSIGSIGGTAVASFVMVPLAGLAWSYTAATAVIAIAATLQALRLRRYDLVVGAAGILGLSLLLTAFPDQRPASVVHDTESPYGRVTVVDQGDLRFLFASDIDHYQTAMRRDDGGALTLRYHDMLLAAPVLAGRPAPRVLMLGVGGGTSLRQIAANWPDAALVGVDIDPEILDVARTLFGLSTLTNLRLAERDARLWVEQDAAIYDVILVDLYRGGQMPFHVGTAEFFQAVARRLAPGGVVMANVLDHDFPALTGALVATARTAFPTVLLADALTGRNKALVAFREAVTLDEVRRRLSETAAPPDAAGVAAEVAETVREWDSRSFPVLTDDWSDGEFRGSVAVN